MPEENRHFPHPGKEREYILFRECPRCAGNGTDRSQISGNSRDKIRSVKTFFNSRRAFLTIFLLLYLISKVSRLMNAHSLIFWVGEGIIAL